MATEINDILATCSELFTLTVNAPSVTTFVPDAQSDPVKRAVVVQLLINGQECDVLVRVYRRDGLINFDLVADQSIAALSTRVAAMNLGNGSAHPSPMKDNGDASAMVAAGGS